MRLTSKASDKRIALRSRVEASIILATARSNHGVKISNCLSRHTVVDAGIDKQTSYVLAMGWVVFNFWRLQPRRRETNKPRRVIHDPAAGSGCIFVTCNAI